MRLARTLSLIYAPKRPHSAAARKFMGDVFSLVPGQDGVLKSARPAMPYRPAQAVPRPWDRSTEGAHVNGVAKRAENGVLKAEPGVGAG